MNPLTDICLRYLDGDLTEAEAKDFDRLIAESPDAARVLAEHLLDEQYFAQAGASQATSSINAGDAADASALNLAFLHLDRSEQSDHVLRELMRMEQHAAILPQNTGLPNGQVPDDRITHDSHSEDAMTWRQATGALAYLIGQAVKSPPGKRLAAAALVLIAATLVLSLGIGTPDDNAPRPGYSPRPADPATPASQPVVATLTAENDARWQYASQQPTPAVGSKLHQGQILKLVSGTAQITTQQGAIANLQAPCTIQLLAGGNALRLEQGKLFGICETPSSKGFVVHTTHMDITDLGTRFGVDASRAGRTEVHIFEGDVSVAAPGARTREREERVTAGQAVAASADTPGLTAVATDEDRFVSIQSRDLFTQRPAASIEGIRSISGTLQAATAAQFSGKDVDQWPSGENAFVFHDFVGRLATEATVDVAEPTGNAKPTTDSGATIPAQTDVRSYIIVKAGRSADVTINAQGSVTFENEVIGIIINEATADRFAAAVQATSPVFSPGNGGQRWLDPNVFNEHVTLSEDRRTVRFQFQVKQAVDTIRVLVRAEKTSGD